MKICQTINFTQSPKNFIIRLIAYIKRLTLISIRVDFLHGRRKRKELLLNIYAYYKSDSIRIANRIVKLQLPPASVAAGDCLKLKRKAVL